MSTSRDSAPEVVTLRGEEIGRVWKVEPRQWAFKFRDGLLIRGFRSTKKNARASLIEQWESEQRALTALRLAGRL